MNWSIRLLFLFLFQSFALFFLFLLLLLFNSCLWDHEPDISNAAKPVDYAVKSGGSSL